jgi:hypothetical protein
LADDILFAAGDYRRALRQYEAHADGTPARSVLVKAADTCERLGDPARAVTEGRRAGRGDRGRSPL